MTSGQLRTFGNILVYLGNGEEGGYRLTQAGSQLALSKHQNCTDSVLQILLPLYMQAIPRTLWNLWKYM